MATASSMTRKAIKPFSVRQRVNRKILRLSLLISTVAVFFTLIVWIASVSQPLHRWKEANLRALSEINCTGIVCNTSAFLADSQSDGANYIVDLQTGYFIGVPTPSVEDPGRFAPLDYSDTGFIARFHQPATYNTPDGEVWRLFSRQANLEGKSLEIIVGSAERASWKTVDTLPSQIDFVDTTLKLEADRIAASLPSHGAQPRGVRGTLSADGFEIVDANTKQVLEWGPWLPVFLPKQTVVPRAGRQLYIYDGDLYLVETEMAGRLLATSLIAVGGLSWIGGSFLIVFIGTGLITRDLSRRFLRGYFAVVGTRVPSLDEALRSGEGQAVEFKRGISPDEIKTSNVEEELLKSVAAFANTNDGVIFVGIDDTGHIKGLKLDFKQRDLLEQKVRQLVRNRIRPTPPFHVTFEDVRGLVIARIVVARGEAPLHIIDGVVYVRYGSSDVQAQPEDLKKLVTQYAF